MELSEILTLLERFDASAATSFKLELGDMRLELEKGRGFPGGEASLENLPAQVTAPVPTAAVPGPQEGTEVRAPLGGPLCLGGRHSEEGADPLRAGGHENDERGARPLGLRHPGGVGQGWGADGL